MKIKAFKWDIEIQEYYVKINGETVATGYIPLGRSNEQIISSDKDADVFFDSVFNAKEPNQLLKDASQEKVLSDMMAKDEKLGLYQPTDCDGTPLRYKDKLICAKDFTCSSGFNWKVGDREIYFKQSNLLHSKELTHSELKNFRKVN